MRALIAVPHVRELQFRLPSSHVGAKESVSNELGCSFFDNPFIYTCEKIWQLPGLVANDLIVAIFGAALAGPGLAIALAYDIPLTRSMLLVT